MKKSTKNILTVAAVLVGGYLLLKTIQPFGMFQAEYPYPAANPYQRRQHTRVF